MDRTTQQEIEQQQLRSAASYHTSLNLTSLPPTDISIVSSHFEDIYPIYSPKQSNTPLEFSITPSASHYLDLYNSTLYLKLKCTDKASASLTSLSKTAPGNFPFASIFQNLDVFVNNVNVSSSSNNYPYSAFINRVLTNGRDAKETRLQAELLLKETLSTASAVDNSNPVYTIMKGKRDGFEVEGKIVNGLFQQHRMFPPNINIRIKLRRSPNTFALVGDDPATGNSFTDLIIIEEAVFRCKRVIVNQRIQQMHENALLEGKVLSYPYKDFDVLTYSIPSGNVNHISETIQMGDCPDAVVVGLVDATAYSGLPSKSAFRFDHNNLSSVSVLLDGEPQLFKDVSMNVSAKKFMSAYSQLFSILSPSEGGNYITPDDFSKFGLCLLVFDLNNAVRENRFSISKKGSLKIKCTFSTSSAKNINVICYLVNSKLLQIDNQNSVFLS